MLPQPTPRGQTQHVTNTEYSVLMKRDPYGYGFQAQDSRYDGDAMRERPFRWVVIETGLSAREAYNLRNELRDGEIDILEYAQVAGAVVS